MKLSELRAYLAEAKEKEDEAKATRLATEKAILEHPDIAGAIKEEGTTTIDGLKVVTGYTRTWNAKKLQDFIDEGIPDNLFPFACKYSEVRNDSKYLEKNEPETWAYIETALTLKPRKPTISIVDLEE